MPHSCAQKPPRRSLRRTARGYLLLPHLAPVIVVELATAGFAVIAWGGVPPLGLLTRLLLAMLGGQLAIGATNELVDLAEDAVGKPHKPLPRGDVSIRGARAMVVGGLLLMIAAGVTLGTASFLILLAGTGLGIAYDLWLKRTPWSWLPYALALPLLPIWVFVSLGRPEPLLFLLYPLGALATVGVHVAQALPDVAADRAAGHRSLTSSLGTARAFAIAWLAALSAPLLAWLGAGLAGLAPEGPPLVMAAVLAVVLAAFNLLVFAVDARAGARVCFPLVAISTAASGIAWTMLVASASR